jgi:hypothetical protein
VGGDSQVSARVEYCSIVLRHFLHQDVQHKNPTHLRAIHTVVQTMAKGDGAEAELAWRLQELAAGEETRPHVRGLTRRLWAACSAELSATRLAAGLLRE